MHFAWQDPKTPRNYRTGVSLHSHTMHSQECLSFLPRYLHMVPGVSRISRRFEQPRGQAVDFSRAYWTPPSQSSLSPASGARTGRSDRVAAWLHAEVRPHLRLIARLRKEPSNQVRVTLGKSPDGTEPEPLSFYTAVISLDYAACYHRSQGTNLLTCRSTLCVE